MKFFFLTLTLFLFYIFLNAQEYEIINMNSMPPPVGYEHKTLKSIKAVVAEETLDVPCYLWSYGCFNTCAAMIAAYYDNHGYDCIYRGGKNGGMAPMKNRKWNASHFYVGNGYYLNFMNSISASEKGYDGRTVDGHVDDFFDWPYSTAPDPDPYIGNTPPHDFSMDYSIGVDHCVADWAGTNQEYWNNVDASTTLLIDRGSGNKCYDFTGYEHLTGTDRARDGVHGFKLYLEDNTGYSVSENYTQLIDTEHNEGFTFNDYIQEIEAGRPIFVFFYGHTCVGMGYKIDQNGNDYIGLFDTWSENVVWLKWGDDLISHSGQKMGMFAVGVIKLYGHLKSGGIDYNCDPIVVGPYDDLEIIDPPINTAFPPLSQDIMQSNSYSFIAGDTINFYACFNSFYCDTWTTTFNWKLELYHKDGNYEYINESTPGYTNWPNYCKSGSQIKSKSPAELPDYQWERNAEGNIIGKLYVETLDNNGYVNKSDEVFVQLEYKPNKPVIKVSNYFNNTSNDIMFSWEDNNDATEYRIYYNSNKIADQGNSPITTTDTHFCLSGLEFFDEVYVSALNDQGESDRSNIINIAQYKSPLFNGNSDYNYCLTISDSCYENTYGRVQVLSNGTLKLDVTTNGKYSHTYADYHFDLLNEKEILFEFDWKHYNDENHDLDGVFFSNDGGGTFTKVMSLNPSQYSANIFNHFTLNIDSIIESNKIFLTNSCVIRLSHYDNYTMPSDGFEFQNIILRSNFIQPNATQSLCLNVIKDAVIAVNNKPGYEFVINNNYGSNKSIKADAWTHSGYKTQNKSLFEFDLSNLPESTVLKKATLNLNAKSPQVTDVDKQMSNLSTGSIGYKSNACWLFRITDSWDEHSVTYASQPSINQTNGYYLPISETYTESYLNLNVTNLVNDMLKYPGASHGFMMELEKEDKYARMVFASSDHENESLHPNLTLEYYINEQVYSIPFSVLGNTSDATDNWDVQERDGNDISYLVYIPSTMSINASTCSNATTYDTKIEIFKANKDRVGAYNDDNSSCSNNPYSSALFDIILSPGYYYFVVDGYSGECGDFELIVTSGSGLKSGKLLQAEFEDSNHINIKIFPNPAIDKIHITTEDINTYAKIIDIHGKILKESKSKSNKHYMDCSDLQKGVYVVQIIGDNIIESRLFKKQ